MGLYTGENMKKLIIIPLASAALLISVLIGCGTTPTALDRALSNVQTNYTPVLGLQTNVVTVFQTNVFVQTVTVTNSVGAPVPVLQTNFVAVPVYSTNLVVVTNQVASYTLTPGSTATAVAGGAGVVANLGAPGIGTLVTGGLLGLLSIFLGFRNRAMSGQNDVLTQASGVLAQTIETGRELMSSTPQGQKVADAFTQWMVTNQAQTQTIGAITQIVKGATNNVEAQAAANQILALIGQPQVPLKPAA
jgi:hypothetical protein